MNWYKKSQDVGQVPKYYVQLGHYDYGFENPENKRITLWMSDLTGGNFIIKKANPTGMYNTHYDLMQERPSITRNFWGRHDPFENIASIQLPLRKDSHYEIDVEDIPNRLIKRLTSEFPGASIYAYPGAIQIV